MFTSTVAALFGILAISQVAADNCFSAVITNPGVLEAVDIAGLTASLNSPNTTSTIFTPTPEALQAHVDDFYDGDTEAFLGNPTLVRELIQYHILVETVDAETLMRGGEWTSEVGETTSCGGKGWLNVGRGGVIYSPFTSARLFEDKINLQAPGCKLLVHIVDTVLVPCLP